MSEIVVDKIYSSVGVKADTKSFKSTIKYFKELDTEMRRIGSAAKQFDKHLTGIANQLKKVRKESAKVTHAQRGLGNVFRKLTGGGRPERGGAGGGIGGASFSQRVTVNQGKGGADGGRRKSGSALGGIGLAGGLGGVAIGGAIAIGRGLASATEAAINFESKMAEVRKVVSSLDDPKNFKEMGQSIRDLATRVPIAAEGLADIVAAGAQSGIAKDELIAFAETAAKVGVAFDISADQAGESFAKVKTGLGLTTDETNKLMGSINELSNNMAAKAPEVLSLVKEVGALGRVAGLSGEQTAALGSSMIAAGANASQATTATKNLFIALTKGNSTSDKTKEAFKRLGLSVTDTAKNMQIDAEATVKDVFTRIRGLNIAEQTEVVNQIFGGISVKSIGPLLKNAELLDKSFKLAQDSGNAAASIQKEFDSRSNTTANTIQLLKNRFENMKIEVGEKLLPVFKSLLKFFDNPAVKEAAGQLFEGFMQGMDYILSNLPNMDGLLKVFIGLIQEAGSAFKTVLDFAKPIFEGVQRFISETGDDFIATFKEIGSAIAELGALITSVFSAAEGDTKGLGSTLLDVFIKNVKIALTSVREGLTMLKNLFSDLRGIVESFKNGNLWEGVLKIGDMLLKAVLEPLRLITRQLIRLTEAIPGMEGFIPDSVRAFAFSGDQQVQAKGGSESPGEGGLSKVSQSIKNAQKKKALDKLLVDTKGIVDSYTTFNGPASGGPAEKTGGKGLLRGGKDGKSGKEEKKDLTAFDELINSKIEEQVQRAELQAGAAGLNQKAAGLAARKRAEQFAKERNFAALGIDPFSMTGPSAKLGTGSDRPPISVVINQFMAGAITGGIHISGSFSGTPDAIGSSLVNQIIDQVSQAAQLRQTPQVS